MPNAHIRHGAMLKTGRHGVQQLDLHIGPFDEILGSSADEISPSQPDNPPGCPSIALLYGYADVNDPGITAVNALVCTQHIKRVSTHTFMTSDQKIVNSTVLSPPDTAYLPASSTNSELTAFPWRIQLPLDASLSMFNQSFFASASNTQTPVDSFFQTVMFGQTPLYPSKIASMGSTKATDRQIVLNAIQAFYGRYMAQAMSVSMRQSLPTNTNLPASKQTSWNVTVHNAGTTFVLIQHRISKIILQVLLLLMSVLMAFAVISLEITGGLDVVRRNPCTIWGRMEVLAERRLREEGERTEDVG